MGGVVVDSDEATDEWLVSGISTVVARSCVDVAVSVVNGSVADVFAVVVVVLVLVVVLLVAVVVGVVVVEVVMVLVVVVTAIVVAVVVVVDDVVVVAVVGAGFVVDSDEAMDE